MHNYHNNKRVYFFLYFVFVLILIYAIQDFQTSRNTTGEIDLHRGLVHVSLCLILFSLSTYLFYSTVVSRIVISYVNFTLWLISGWILIANIIQNTIAWSVAVQLGLSILWILVYYLFCFYLRRFPEAWPPIQLGILVMFGFHCFSAFYAAYTIRMSYERIVAINLVYSVLVFLPWITLISNKIKRRLCLFIVLIIVLISMKRGALLVFPVMLSAGLIVEAVVRKRVWKAIFKIILLIVLFSVGILIADQVTGGYLFARFSLEEMSGGSSRLVIYGMTIESLSQSSLWTLFLGRGSGAVEQLLDTAAHNEWLEFLYNFGVIGVFFYALLFLTLGCRLVGLMRRSSRFASGYAMAVVYFFVVGMFGQIYFAHSTLYIMAFFGAADGLMLNDFRNSQRLVYSQNHYRGA